MFGRETSAPPREPVIVVSSWHVGARSVLDDRFQHKQMERVDEGRHGCRRRRRHLCKCRDFLCSGWLGSRPIIGKVGRWPYTSRCAELRRIITVHRHACVGLVIVGVHLIKPRHHDFVHRFVQGQSDLGHVTVVCPYGRPSQLCID